MSYELIKKVENMRNAQKMYFQTRKKVALIKAKELEKEVDSLLMQTKLNKAPEYMLIERQADGQVYVRVNDQGNLAQAVSTAQFKAPPVAKVVREANDAYYRLNQPLK